MRAAAALLLTLLLALGVAACGSDDDDTTGETSGGEAGAIVSNPENGDVTLTVGSKNFTEQIVLGEVYAQALEAAGYKVRKQLNLGSETVARQAVKSGQISGYPEYASTALTSFFEVEPEQVPADATEAYEEAKADFEEEGLTAFP
ncbi:MAG TPA: glycine betaine ABC transporter substrate-binding protein, partial [Solirubrobacterales bacterium]|nr:glycine betaine ABC transporter substrate-binding protein [Solirubrobacterales bacterium]